jgi:protein TonB
VNNDSPIVIHCQCSILAATFYTMKPYLVLAILLIPFCAVAQSDTIFFNRTWSKTTRDSAVFFRLAKEDGKLFLVKDYFVSTHKLQMVGHFNNMQQEYREGWFVYYDSTGHITSQGNYLNDKREGKWKTNYLYSDTLWSVSYYNNGAVDGTDTLFFVSGNIRRTETYKNDEWVSGKCFDTNGREIPYYPYQVDPKFPGGVEAISNFIAKEVNYPKAARNKGVEGRVLVGFVIETDGSLSDIKIIQSVAEELDNEALRVINKMPKWTPGKLDNQPARFSYTQPISFQLK